MEYTVDYFIKKFEAIPEVNWLAGQYASSDNSVCCALGHCHERTDVRTLNPLLTQESMALRSLFLGWLGFDVSDVNDGYEEQYNQHTPKSRTLAGLYDIKRLMAVKENASDRIVYLTVDESIRELQLVDAICSN